MNTQHNPSFSREEVLLYRDCPRCFFLFHEHHIVRPGAKPTEGDLSVLEHALEMDMIKSLQDGAPLQDPNCVYCKYRQLVRGTGIENELTA